MVLKVVDVVSDPAMTVSMASDCTCFMEGLTAETLSSSVYTTTREISRTNCTSIRAYKVKHDVALLRWFVDSIYHKTRRELYELYASGDQDWYLPEQRSKPRNVSHQGDIPGAHVSPIIIQVLHMRSVPQTRLRRMQNPCSVTIMKKIEPATEAEAELVVAVINKIIHTPCHP
jgi:hypothetical protein